ncbi:MAG: response regulator [Alphaproteobacteria bacterium]|jgi:DNA-binding response OmpR family regulator|nr:response regulator [Alphaproteobacteria bacterium]MDP6815709.1 response regulator [Alphaproteobacteria bacterium]
MRARILLIDDDDLVRNVLARMLAAADYEVIEAADGDEGTRMYQGDNVDLVIADIVMPNMEGVETIGKLRQADRKLKIIAISGRSRFGNQINPESAEALWVDAILAKPIRQKDLLAKVDAVLNA